MRIISGIYKNRRINFNNLRIRPTTDFAKESLFNVLSNYYDFNKISVLDLFAGSGNISYEFISRGSTHTTAIDSNLKCVKFMQKIQSKFAIDNFNIQHANSVFYLKKTQKKYDLIFADPPYTYQQNEYDKIINLIFEKNILNTNGTLILEHSKLINFETCKYFYMKKRYGSVNFSFLKNEE
ncbi:MAG: 16S rRNA (guanine(966)-N(2))-methyltransferase RsmD [Flavobacteriales bacterium]|nr:16S rRNA (guanine(966)-N(2))-methyltransferase RsmD [Flavobacteriales bacterium]|tara:strand:- start:211 stop:753 length:543 start_codon:yes stop_codon:yes gene_type:complete